MDVKIKNFLKILFFIVIQFSVNSCIDKKNNNQVFIDTGRIVYCGWLPKIMNESSCSIFKPQNTINIKCFRNGNDHFMKIAAYDEILPNDQVLSEEVAQEYYFRKLKIRFPENKISSRRVALEKIEGELVESIGNKTYWGQFSFSHSSKTFVFVYQGDNNSSSEFRKIINSIVECPVGTCCDHTSQTAK